MGFWPIKPRLDVSRANRPQEYAYRARTTKSVYANTTATRGATKVPEYPQALWRSFDARHPLPIFRASAFHSLSMHDLFRWYGPKHADLTALNSSGSPAILSSHADRIHAFFRKPVASTTIMPSGAPDFSTTLARSMPAPIRVPTIFKRFIQI